MRTLCRDEMMSGLTTEQRPAQRARIEADTWTPATKTSTAEFVSDKVIVPAV